METAVEQLVQEINKLTGLNIAMDEPCVIQAKAMEKEQIVDAYLKGYLEEIPNPSKLHYYKDMAEQYYNETFKTE